MSELKLLVFQLSFNFQSYPLMPNPSIESKVPNWVVSFEEKMKRIDYEKTQERY